MACIINASTSAGLVQTADTSGILQFQQNGVALPNGGVAPAFSAYASSATSLSNGAFTKITFDTELFDTNNNFASNRFTPTVAGYYQLNSAVSLGAWVATVTVIMIYKNGSELLRGTVNANTSASIANVVSGLVYANGSTDYFEIYGYQNSGIANSTGSGANLVWFNGSLVRGT